MVLLYSIQYLILNDLCPIWVSTEALGPIEVWLMWASDDELGQPQSRLANKNIGLRVSVH